MLNSTSSDVRKYAISKITDQDVLKKAVNNTDYGVVLRAIENIKDPIFLKELLTTIDDRRKKQYIVCRLEYLESVTSKLIHNSGCQGEIVSDIEDLKQKITTKYTKK